MGFFSKILGNNQPDFIHKTPFENPVDVDLHSHLIFGVDDGCENMEQSIELLKGFAEMGMRKVITTPHVMGDYYKNNPGILLPVRDKIREELKKQNIQIEFECAAEYLIDDLFEPKIASGELLTFGSNKKYVLIELSFMEEPRELKQVLFQLQVSGYTPVLAHPERYLYFTPKKERYHELKDQGILFQMNMLSTIGYYGKPTLDMAEYLIKNKLIDMVGSDTHRIQHQQLLKEAYKSKLFYTLVHQTELLNKFL
ncbi:MAG: tyrosine-protein phosphatase [Bacteroidia bacterium]